MLPTSQLGSSSGRFHDPSLRATAQGWAGGSNERMVTGRKAVVVFLRVSAVSASGFVHLIPQVPWALPTLDVGLERAARAEYELGVQAWNLRQAEQGLELFLRSAQKGHEVGEYCFRYGMYHELPPSDMQQAFRWYKRGARMNHKGSTTMLGKLHMAAGHRDEAVHFLQRTGLPNKGRLVMDEFRCDV